MSISGQGEALCVQGTALDMDFLDDGSVDLIITSPPYFGLRSYKDGGEHYEGQIGAEATPAEFVDALIAATREMMRVLKPSGSMWINLGDKYNAYNGNRGEGTIQANGIRQGAPKGNGLDVKDVRPKSLIGIPWRYAIRCIDDLGLILRAEVIWSKANGLPESVTDRVRRSHEQWFHMTLNPRYYSAVDEVREPQETADRKGERRSYPAGSASSMGANGEHQAMTGSFAGLPLNPLGKLPGSVWTIPTEPLRVPEELGIDHFAAFPTEWPRRIITGWSPRGVCVECGEGRRPVSDVTQEARRPIGVAQMHTAMDARAEKGTKSNIGHVISSRTITGEACDCPEPTAPTTPGIVLDPFGGTGTTALVSSVLGRIGISVDLSSDYTRLAQWRTTDQKQREGVAARASACPKCGSASGAKCVNSEGKSVSMHAARKAAGAAMLDTQTDPDTESTASPASL